MALAFFLPCLMKYRQMSLLVQSGRSTIFAAICPVVALRLKDCGV